MRANCILPGLIDTPIYGTRPASDEFKARLGTGVLFPKRLGRSEEFASLAVELLANSYMNAESIRIDAGVRLQPKSALTARGRSPRRPSGRLRGPRRARTGGS